MTARSSSCGASVRVIVVSARLATVCPPYFIETDLGQSSTANARSVSLRPRQHPTPGEGEECRGILAPLFPLRRQVGQLRAGGNPVACDGGTQFLTPAFAARSRAKAMTRSGVP